MSDLTAFRDHCRRMARTGHRVDCHTQPEGPSRRGAPICMGCIPDDDRALFSRLAAEVDAYLARDPDVVQVAEEQTAAMW